MAGALSRSAAPAPIAFLFLGETLLVPHLWPIVEALAARLPGQPIDLWVATSVHEALLGEWSVGLDAVRLRRAPGFRFVPLPGDGRNPVLPTKIPMLLRLAPQLIGARAVICAEQTSLWLPTLAGFALPPFVKTSHGAGSVSARDDRRRAAAALTLVPGELERATYLARGLAPDRVIATGYVKSDFRHRAPPRSLFPEARPTIVYAPHWQRHRSSWWEWGRAIVDRLVAQRDWNVILVPHQRLFEKDPQARALCLRAAGHRHVRTDATSFAMVDGTYLAAADLYLGDTSSQVIEYLARPRPCVFLNAQGINWRATDDHGFWECGEVVDRPNRVLGAIAEAPARHADYRPAQEALAAAALGPMDGGAPQRCARAIADLVAR